MKTSREKYLNIKKIKKQVKGITLIALVVTIIVLLILAGIALNLTIGQNGIFSRAQQAKEISEKAEWKEKIDMAISTKLMDNSNATLDDIIQELINEDIIDEESQVNKDNGDITTNKPSYVISEKLNDFLSNVKIIISKTPETEKSGGVILKVERVEGIENTINLNDIDISKLNDTEKKQLIKEITLKMATMIGINVDSFEDFLKDKELTEQEYWNKLGDIDSYLDELIDTLTSARIETINSYTTINPEGETSNSILVTKNGKYKFEVTEILTGKIYTETVEVNNIDESMPYYLVKGSIGEVFLIDKNKNTTNFEKAYIIYEGEKIDITDCIKEEQEKCYISIIQAVYKLVSVGKIESDNKLYMTTQIFELVKDGKSYSDNVLIDWIIN